ncbi:helix-turn-helix domain-containing protein [Kribbella sp. NPDC003505]|uniref:helix-turn-helix domain-containing protein n=1 Tax=Kribbella sp. NPDC003505 TaxID=3154448 RepID=UPI0033A9B92B
MASNDLYTVEEAAQRMRLSARQVRRLVAERQIGFHKLGRSVRLTDEDVVTYIASNRVEPMTAADVWAGLRKVA